MENTEKKSDAAGAKSLILLYPHAADGNAFLQQLRSTMQAEASVHIHDATSEKDIAEQLQGYGRGLLIFCVRQKEDLTLVLNMMTALSASIKSKALRVIGVNEINHAQIPELLMKRGCADVFSSKLNPKALRHKINQALKIVATYVPPQSSTPQAEAGKKSGAAQPAPQNVSLLNKLAPLAIASDCWLVRKERDMRRVQGRWIVDLIGPGPSSGTWEEKSAPQASGPVWEWKPKALADGSISEKEFVKDDGAWTYVGRRPEFVWDIGRWRFLGEQMELSFKKGEELIACRFKLVDGAIEFAENSPQAKQMLPLIIKSIENEVRFHNEAKAKPAAGKKFTDEDSATAAPGTEVEVTDSEEGPKAGTFDLEKDAPDSAPELELALGRAPESPELETTLEKPEEVPFTQAPQPKLTIWVAQAKLGDGEKVRPVKANPIELSEETLVLEAATGEFHQGDDVVVVMDDGLMKDESKTRFRCALERVEQGSEGTDTLTLRIDPQILIFCKPIREIFDRRQEEIVNFLKAARGW